MQDWFYDTATNSIQNGGVHPKQIKPTTISKEQFIQILKDGLSESLWSPVQTRTITQKQIKTNKKTDTDLSEFLKEIRENL